MATQNVCKFNKFGFCKFKETCRKQHVMEICENSSCAVSTCIFRHPRMCRFFRDFGRCKFTVGCSYVHGFKKNEMGALDISTLKSENDKLINLIQILEKKILEMDIRIDVLEKQNKADKDGTIHTEMCNTKKPKENIEILKETLKCEKCKFETIHKNGLKIHMKKKHESKIVNNSKICDLCEKNFKSVREMKIHRNTHSFQSSNNEKQFNCEECDFVTENVESMEVHIGKCCYEYYECGLCENRFDCLENLETHLTTCEVYECGFCLNCMKNLDDMKKHVICEPLGYDKLHHIKMNSHDKTKVDFKQYSTDTI
eukprot:GFUD01070439.1.p1 GENE.GFUD01070439.1~~GFUD01070439.1.p1  ORF type:complete len:313 (+),score=42.55 GFUD01070439.1:267-1205(+)